MSFFISDAWAQAEPAAPGGGDLIGTLLPFVVLFIVFYFLLIRPQSKRAKEHKQMVENLAKGDEVVTQGGILGKVTEVGETFIELEAGDNVRLKVQRQAVGSVVPKGTVKSSL